MYSKKKVIIHLSEGVTVTYEGAIDVEIIDYARSSFSSDSFGDSDTANSALDSISIYTSGSCTNNHVSDGRRCFIGIAFSDNAHDNISKEVRDSIATNTRADMLAVLTAVKVVNTDISEPRHISIYSNNESLINCLRDPTKSRKSNTDIWKRIGRAFRSSQHTFEFVHARRGECRLSESLSKIL